MTKIFFLRKKTLYLISIYFQIDMDEDLLWLSQNRNYSPLLSSSFDIRPLKGVPTLDKDETPESPSPNLNKTHISSFYLSPRTEKGQSLAKTDDSLAKKDEILCDSQSCESFSRTRERGARTRVSMVSSERLSPTGDSVKSQDSGFSDSSTDGTRVEQGQPTQRNGADTKLENLTKPTPAVRRAFRRRGETTKDESSVRKDGDSLTPLTAMDLKYSPLTPNRSTNQGQDKLQFFP